MLTVLPDELIVHVIEQVADLHAAFNLHFGTVVDSLVRGSYPASALRPLLPLCCVSRRLRTICLPIAMRDIYFNARPSHECMVRFPADDSTRSMRNRVAEDYIFSHPEVSSLVQCVFPDAFSLSSDPSHQKSHCNSPLWTTLQT